MSYYDVKLDGVSIYDPSELPLTFIDPKAICGLSDAGSFDFVMPRGHVFYNNIVPYGSTIEVFEDGKSIFYGRPTLPKLDFYNSKQVHCEGALAFLNDVVVPPVKVKGGEKITMKEYIQALFEYYNNTCRREDRKLVLGKIELKSDQSAKHVWNYETCFDILRTGILPYTGSYVVTRRENNITYVDFVYKFNNIINQPIKMASNLLDLTKSGQEFYTAVIAKGASDAVQMLSPMTADNALVQKYGFICAYKEYPNCETIADLQMQCSVFLKSQQFSGMSFEASATDLHLENSAMEQFMIGSVAKIDSPFHDFVNNFKAAISRIEISLDTGEKKATLLTLSQQILTISDTEDYQYQRSEYDPNYDYEFPDGYDYFYEPISIDDMDWEPSVWVPDPYDPSKFEEKSWEYFFDPVDVDDLEWTPEIWVPDPLDPDNYIKVEWPEDEPEPPIDPEVEEVLVKKPKEEVEEEIGDVEEVLVKKPAEDLEDVEEGTKIVTPVDPENPNNVEDAVEDKPVKPVSIVDEIIKNAPEPETPELPGDYSDYTPIKGEDGNSYVVKIDENGDIEADKIPDTLKLTDGTDPITSIEVSSGDIFDSSDITPQLQYGDGTSVPTSDITYNIPDGYEFKGDGTDPTSLTATWTDPSTGITYTDSIDINGPSAVYCQGIYFANLPSRYYRVGQAFSLDGYIVTASFSDGSTRNITSSCQFSLNDGYVFTSEAPSTITAMYIDGGTTFTASAAINFTENKSSDLDTSPIEQPIPTGAHYKLVNDATSVRRNVIEHFCNCGTSTFIRSGDTFRCICAASSITTGNISTLSEVYYKNSETGEYEVNPDSIQVVITEVTINDTYTHDGKTVYYSIVGFGSTNQGWRMEDETGYAGESSSLSTDLPGRIAWTLVYGN